MVVQGSSLRDLMQGMSIHLVHPPKARPGDKVAVLSPSFAAPGFAPGVHEQAMRRLTEVTGLVPVEYPTTRRLGASAQDRADDVNAAFADPEIRAVLATIGGDDLITVVPHLDPDLPRADPKPFLGYSDNTNLLSWLWTHGIAGFYGGSTQVHLGPGPGVDPCHATALRAALLTGERLEVTDPGESEDVGKDWLDPAALTEYGDRQPTEPWTWAGPARPVTGRTWGGCLEVLQWLLTAGRFPADPAVLDGGVLLVEASEEIIPAREVGWILRSLGERGVLAAVDAVLVARPPAANLERHPSPEEAAAHRAEQRDTAIDVIGRYNREAVVCVGVPFGHTRPQWILPYGGEVTVDGAARRLWADYR
jgi:muramoyltetrapeptide carboxypeptidase LdcA involved in peptidoglycan recycling